MQHDAMHDPINVCHHTRKISRLCCLDTTTRSGGTFQAELNAIYQKGNKQELRITCLAYISPPKPEVPR